jgi:hypothetical protein
VIYLGGAVMGWCSVEWVDGGGRGWVVAMVFGMFFSLHAMKADRQ